MPRLLCVLFYHIAAEMQAVTESNGGMMAILGLPLVHVMEEAIEAGVASDSLTAFGYGIIGLCAFGPSVFMICMGFGIGGKVAPDSVRRTGIQFLLIGAILNVVRWLIPGMDARTSPDGEVELRGPVVMQGYYGNPEATVEVMTEDGWYRTGDLGYVDADRFLFLTGRKKNLIILSNGENISPEELEANFQVDDGVNEVLVYEQGNKLVAEIYPEEAYKGNEAYFQELMLRINQNRPLSKQIAAVKLRDVEFIKNTTKKIVRNKNIPQE